MQTGQDALMIDGQLVALLFSLVVILYFGVLENRQLSQGRALKQSRSDVDTKVA